MSNEVSTEVLTQVSARLRDQIGLWFSPERYPDLKRGLKNAGQELGLDGVEACARHLLKDRLTRAEVEILARHLTIGETYFFRDERSFVVLREEILRPLLQARRTSGRTLRMWSAACSSGEEAYSLAMLLHETVPDIAQWDITILATDLNPDALNKARAARYSPWSFRALPDALRDKYFTRQEGNRYTLRESIQKMVKFEYLNLAEDAFPSPLSDTVNMDIILCRNVLMYFAPATAQSIIHKMHRSLVEGGYLLLSANEGPHINYKPFQTLHFGGAIAYRKSSAATTPIGANTVSINASPPPSPSAKAAPRAGVARNRIAAHPRPAARPSTPSSPPSSTTQPSANEAVARARSFYERGEYRQAIPLLESLVNTTPTADRLALLARCHANTGDLASAARWCDAALAADKLNARLHYLRSIIWQEQNQMQEAAGALRRALYLDHDFIAAHFALGNLARAQNNGVEATRHFNNAKRLLQVMPTDATVPEIEDLSVERLLEMIERMT